MVRLICINYATESTLSTTITASIAPTTVTDLYGLTSSNKNTNTINDSKQIDSKLGTYLIKTKTSEVISCVN